MKFKHRQAGLVSMMNLLQVQCVDVPAPCGYAAECIYTDATDVLEC